MFIDVAFFAWFGISDDAACHGSSYLACHYFYAFGSFDDYHRALVVRTGFGQPRFHEFAVLVSHFLDGAVYGIPVSVYVDQTHEDRNHQATVVKIFVFLDFFNNYNFPVGRGYYDLFSVLTEKANWAAEEIYQYAVYDKTDGSDNIPRNFVF